MAETSSITTVGVQPAEDALDPRRLRPAMKDTRLKRARKSESESSGPAVADSAENDAHTLDVKA